VDSGVCLTWLARCGGISDTPLKWEYSRDQVVAQEGTDSPLGRAVDELLSASGTKGVFEQ